MKIVLSLLVGLMIVCGCGAVCAETAVEPQILARGKVVDGEGKAVANARVAGTLEQPLQQDSYYTESAKDGTFEVAVRNTLKYRALARFSAGKKGYSDADRVTTPPLGKAGYKEMTLVLRPAVDLVVNVVDTEGKAVAGAEVVVPRNYSDGEEKDKPWMTDGEGRAVLRGQNDKERMTFEVTAAGYLKGKGWAEDLTKGSVKIVLAKGGEWVCQVMDMETGKPVAGAAVELPFLESAKYTTDKEGIFRAADVPFGMVRVVLPGSGYTHDWDHALGGFMGEFAAGSVEKVHKLVVRHDYVIEGNVVDGAKRAVAGATVWLEPMDIETRHDKLAAQTKTDAKGHFRFDGVSVDHFRVTVGGGYRSAAVECRYKELKGWIEIVAEVKRGD